ncbi:MAG: hypothetical protein P4L49_18950 [Desulfosporosinus sp.]|nr:hypothetical protein [Desulfosporosinus sp.]
MESKFIKPISIATIRGYSDQKENSDTHRYNIISIPVLKDDKIYNLLGEYCNFFFVKSQETIDISFYTKEYFVVFATDHDGGFYGFIGGLGDVIHDNYPIGYISSDNKAGRIANNLKELFSLIIFNPFWQDLLKGKDKEISNNFSEIHLDIAKTLSVHKDEQDIENLKIRLTREPFFTLYSKIDDNPSTQLQI